MTLEPRRGGAIWIIEYREDSNHPLLIGFAALAFTGVVIGSVMMFTRRQRKR
ncbi:MAG: hypothetical protein U5J78_01905 [Parasphingorhabdus sp.]|nr:hypothetical protein [Parasphingorhabdus sp.]